MESNWESSVIYTVYNRHKMGVSYGFQLDFPVAVNYASMTHIINIYNNPFLFQCHIYKDQESGFNDLWKTYKSSSFVWLYIYSCITMFYCNAGHWTLYLMSWSVLVTNSSDAKAL